jgi:hypothetical protein
LNTVPLSSTQTRLVAEDGHVLVHDLAELGLDLGDATAFLRAVDDLADAALFVLDDRPGDVRLRDAERDLGGMDTRAAAEDERVEQRVRAQAVTPVDRDACHFAGGVEAVHVGVAVHVGLDAAHDVVIAGLDVDRLARDVDAGEVAADVDDLAQRLVDALARDHRDVQRDGAVREAAALVDLRLLGA